MHKYAVLNNTGGTCAQLDDILKIINVWLPPSGYPQITPKLEQAKTSLIK